MTPGNIPATNKSMMETLATRPNRMSGIEGGIKTDTVEEAELIAAANPLG